MKCKIVLLFLLISFQLINSQNYPGGVTNVEMWYKAKWEHLYNQDFPNSSQNTIKLENCGSLKENLFNFNYSFYGNKLCFSYKTPLENSIGRDLFFVGEPEIKELRNEVFSHIVSMWQPQITNENNVQRNFFDLNDNTLFSLETQTEYESDQNAYINFYHTNNYNIDQKFKSYGKEGETEIFIGRSSLVFPDNNHNNESFIGNFPEFISFNKELNANERIRVSSYLALKYGLTLNKETSYLSSKNIIFWNEKNNIKFGNRIFGFGKDDISGLNQLQSESTHLKNHLVSAVGEIMETNFIKQEKIFIDNNHFLVFGDNNKSDRLENTNNKKISYWGKTWLAQRTGEKVDTYPIDFKLYLNPEIQNYLHENPDHIVWMLHDEHVNNTEVSDFQSEYVKYYESSYNADEQTAYFKDILFDQDRNIYDQYTFGVGPKMIVEVQAHGCKGDKTYATIVITGGRPKYKIIIDSPNFHLEDATLDNTFDFPTEVGETYHIIVVDDQGLVVETDITISAWGFNIDLGPDQVLTNENSPIELNAGVGISDPNATYQWYWEGNLLSNNSSTLNVNEPGIYYVEATSEDLSCTVSDEIVIADKGIVAFLTPKTGCDQEHNSLELHINNGFAPFTTTLTGENSSVNYVHNGTTTISNIPYGDYSVTITDNEGNTYYHIVSFTEPVNVDFGLDLYSQLVNICSQCVDEISFPGIPFFDTSLYNNSFTLDASNGVNNPNIQYKWFMNDIQLPYTQPILSFEYNANCWFGNRYNLFSVEIFDPQTNCSQIKSFGTLSTCAFESVQTNSNNPFISEENVNTSISKMQNNINTIVYPNPSEPDALFNFEVFSEEIINGVIEIFNASGVKIYSEKIEGEKHYNNLLNIKVAGAYIIRLTTDSNEIKVNRIIIK